MKICLTTLILLLSLSLAPLPADWPAFATHWPACPLPSRPACSLSFLPGVPGWRAFPAGRRALPGLPARALYAIAKAVDAFRLESKREGFSPLFIASSLNSQVRGKFIQFAENAKMRVSR